MNDPVASPQRGGCLRTFLIVVLALAAGGFGGYQIWSLRQPAGTDPVEVIVTQMKTHSVIEHERQVAVWYRACPTVWGKSPQIFMAWPAVLTYQIELGDVQVSRHGGVIHVRTAALQAVDPSVPTDHMAYMASTSVLTFANEQELINEEIAKATPVSRYLSTYFLVHDPSLEQDFREEVQSLVEHFTASLGLPITRVDVDIPKVEVSSWPPLPKIELCPGTTAAVNGVPFAKFGVTSAIPIAFPIPARHGSGGDAPASGESASSSSTGPAAPAPAAAGVLPAAH
jgi:hypothetical protein